MLNIVVVNPEDMQGPPINEVHVVEPKKAGQFLQARTGKMAMFIGFDSETKVPHPYRGEIDIPLEAAERLARFAFRCIRRYRENLDIQGRLANAADGRREYEQKVAAERKASGWVKPETREEYAKWLEEHQDG